MRYCSSKLEVIQVSDKLRIDEAKKMMAKNLKSTANQLGAFLESESKSRTPVDTGHLRRSITNDVTSSNTKATVFVGSNVEYDPYVELGTSKQKAQPHHLPAVTENVSKINNLIRKGMIVK